MNQNENKVIHRQVTFNQSDKAQSCLNLEKDEEHKDSDYKGDIQINLLNDIDSSQLPKQNNLITKVDKESVKNKTKKSSEKTHKDHSEINEHINDIKIEEIEELERQEFLNLKIKKKKKTRNNKFTQHRKPNDDQNIKPTNRVAMMKELKRKQIEMIKNDDMNINLYLDDTMYVEDYDSSTPHNVEQISQNQDITPEIDNSIMYKQSNKEIILE